VAILVALAPACHQSDDGFVPVSAPAAGAVAAAGDDYKALTSVPGNYYSTPFDAPTGWVFTPPSSGVGWDVDSTPSGVPGGPARSAATSLNYNNGTDFDSGAANSGSATSPAINLAGLGAPVLVFWCNYQTETTGTAKDRRWVRVSNDGFATTRLNQQLAGTASAPYLCAAMGAWHRHAIPLQGSWGSVQVRFFFETLDAAANAGGGWFIDDLSIELQLSARGSWDRAGGSVTYLWQQISGTAVALSDPAAMEPTYQPPATAGSLQFRLTVTAPSGTDRDTVEVAVKDVLVMANDAWFVGYEKAVTIVPLVNGAPGAYTFSWTGFEDWLSPSIDPATGTIGATTPKLTDFQNFPDRAEVAVLERTTQGRLQLKVQLKSGATVLDEDYVNFSPGPFSDTAANENVAFGEPVFLNGAATIPTAPTPTTIATWTWTGIKPNGTAVAFKRPDLTTYPGGPTADRFVSFVPDLLGLYEIQVEQNPGNVTKVINLTCGKFVGVGNLTGTTPDPFRGECAACHAGQFGWLADFANPWRETGHAHMFERILDPANPLNANLVAQNKHHWNDAFNYGSNYSIDSRTVGWSRITAGSSGGWAEQATADAYVFKDSTWSEIVRKHPRTAGLSNIQCESCHGPGSEHAGDSTRIRKSFDANLCGRCHSRKQDQWEAGPHGKPPIVSPSGSASCNNCHTAQGYVVEMRAQEGADPHQVLFAVSNLNRPVIPLEDRRGTTCQACHEPHKRTANRGGTGPDPQLRAFGNVQFRNGAIANAGVAASCYMCHQSRTDTRAGSPDFIVRRAPHDSTMAEMLSGTNGMHYEGWSYLSSPHGIPSRFVTPARSENRQCLACHVDVQPVRGVDGYNALGGHTFTMKQGDDSLLADTSNSVNPYYSLPAVTVGGSGKFTLPAGPSFLRSVFTGDEVAILGGSDLGTYRVGNVDGARQLTLTTPPPANAPVSFAGGTATSWTLRSVAKHNTASCVQCHTTGPKFEDVARGDYDGSSAMYSSPGLVQSEIDGLRAKLLPAITAKLAALTDPARYPAYTGLVFELYVSGGRIRYRNTPSGTVVRTFPGPGVPLGDNPEIPWSSLTPSEQAEWEALYKAAYNWVFVGNDKSRGIHNTGYAVMLLQSAYQALTGTAAGAPFVPFP
jgi:hypothetical protein